MPDACIDAIVTDPPYSSGGFTRGDRTGTTTKYTLTGAQVERPEFARDNRNQRSFGYWCALWLSECLRVAKPGAPISVFSDWRHLPTTTDVLQAGGFVWRGLVVRDKTEACRPAMGRFLAQCEYIVWGTAGPSQDREDVGCLWGAIREPVRVADKHHITGKPTAVMHQLVRVCPPIGTAVDPFAGSGTTGVAALLEGRRFVGDRDRRRVRDDCARAAPGGRGRRRLNDFRAGQEPLFGRVGT